MSTITEQSSKIKVQFENIIKYYIRNWNNMKPVTILDGIKLYCDKNSSSLELYWKGIKLSIYKVVETYTISNYIETDIESDNISGYIITWVDNFNNNGKIKINFNKLNSIDVKTLDNKILSIPFDECNNTDFFMYDVIGVHTPCNPYVLLELVNKIIEVHNEKIK